MLLPRNFLRRASNLSYPAAAIRIPNIPWDATKAPLHKFRDRRLETRVFTHVSADNTASTWDSFLTGSPQFETPAASNEQLEWLGDAILRGMTADLIYSFPEMNECKMTLLLHCLVNNGFYAHVTRLLGLDRKIILSATAPEELIKASDRVLGGLFEAYVGGMYQDLGGVKGYEKVYGWFRALMEPYAKAYLKVVKEEEEVIHKKTKWREPVIKEGHNFVSWLNDFRARYNLPEPEVRFTATEIQNKTLWGCEVGIGTKKFMQTEWRTTRAEAKNDACRQAVSWIQWLNSQRGDGEEKVELGDPIMDGWKKENKE